MRRWLVGVILAASATLAHAERVPVQTVDAKPTTGCGTSDAFANAPVSFDRTTGRAWRCNTSTGLWVPADLPACSGGVGTSCETGSACQSGTTVLLCPAGTKAAITATIATAPGSTGQVIRNIGGAQGADAKLDYTPTGSSGHGLTIGVGESVAELNLFADNTLNNLKLLCNSATCTICFEGAIALGADTAEQCIQFTNPTADRTQVVQNASGTQALLEGPQTHSGTHTFTGSLIPPHGTTPPGTCDPTASPIFIDTDASAGQRLLCCNSTNTWSQCNSVSSVSGAGGGPAEIQYNNGGALGGDPTFVFDGGTGAVSAKILQGAREGAAYASGTGTSLDPYTSFSAALAADTPTHLRAGVWKLTSSLAIPAGATLYGDGDETKIVFDQTGTPNAGITVTGVSGVTIRDLYIDHDGNTNPSSVAAIQIDASSAGSGFVVENVHIVDAAKDGVRVIGKSGTKTSARIIGVVVEGAKRHGIEFSNFVSGSSAVACRVQGANGDASQHGQGIFASGAESLGQAAAGITLTANIVEGGENCIRMQGSDGTAVGNTCTSPLIDGIRLRGSKMTATGNTVLSAGEVGIKSEDGTDHTITSNTVRGSGQEGIQVRFSNTTPTIINVSANTSSGNTLNGILVRGAQDGTVSGNVVSGNGQNGISLEGPNVGGSRSTSGFLVSGNTVSGNGTGGSYDDIRVSTTGSPAGTIGTVVIRDNLLDGKNVATGGINVLAAGTDVRVEDNTSINHLSSDISIVSGVYIKHAGPGAPTLGARNGSVWYRTDGGANQSVYIRENSAWWEVGTTWLDTAGRGIAGSDLIAPGLVGVGSASLGSASCVGVTGDRLYADENCDGAKGGTEEFLTLGDSDKGDVTVSGTGTVFTVDPRAITGGKVALATLFDENVAPTAAIAGGKIQTNSSSNPGVVPSSSGQLSKCYSTDGTGTPGWNSCPGGSPGFGSVTTGTSGVALHVGTGGSLDPTGSGTVTANTYVAGTVNNAAVSPTAAIDGTKLGSNVYGDVGAAYVDANHNGIREFYCTGTTCCWDNNEDGTPESCTSPSGLTLTGADTFGTTGSRLYLTARGVVRVDPDDTGVGGPGIDVAPNTGTHVPQVTLPSVDDGGLPLVVGATTSGNGVKLNANGNLVDAGAPGSCSPGNAVVGTACADVATQAEHDADVALQTAHGSTSAATASKIMQRDASGRVDVVAPAAADNTTKVITSAWYQTESASKAPLASPTFTGTPAAPTAAANTNTTQVATTQYVQTELTAVPFTLTWMVARSNSGAGTTGLVNLDATTGPSIANQTGTNQKYAGLSFDPDATECMSVDTVLPTGWTSTVQATLSWWAAGSNTTTDASTWTFETACLTDGDVDTTWNAATTVTDANAGTTANRLMVFTTGNLDTTGCAAGELMFLHVCRVGGGAGNGAPDTLAVDAVVPTLALTLRRDL